MASVMILCWWEPVAGGNQETVNRRDCCGLVIGAHSVGPDVDPRPACTDRRHLRPHVYVALDDHERATAELEKLAEKRAGLPFVFVDPRFDPPKLRPPLTGTAASRPSLLPRD